MRPLRTLFFLVALAVSAFAQNLKPLADRLAAQNALFEEQYESDLGNFPERATAFGDYRYNDKLGDRSLDAIAQFHKTDEAFLTRLEAIPTTGFSDQDQLSHNLLVRVLRQRIADYDLKEYEMPINQQNGVHTSLADLPLSIPLDSLQHYEDYISRLHQIPRALTTLSITSLPNGEKRYQNDIYARTTTHMSPDEIHQLGLREIDRIQAEMLAIAKKQGFADLASFRASFKSDSKYIPTSAEQILEDFRHYIAQMEPKLPELFTLLPRSPVTVEAIPAFQAAAATHYVTGTADGKRAGRVVVATSNFAERSLINDEAIAYHEGIPRHHMQLSVQQQLAGLPKFRLHGLGFNAYTEGWALYAEQLGKEVGFYQDPVSDYGRLSSELFRAVRLVVDTGIHAKGWTRDQVVDFFRKSGAVDEPTIQSETDRYIAWPAQALAYKLGQLKFRELRDRARMKLGARFDIRSFHDEMLNGGVLPLDLLDSRTDKWIAQEKSK